MGGEEEEPKKSKVARAEDPIFDDLWVLALQEHLGACRHNIVGGCRKCVRHAPQ